MTGKLEQTNQRLKRWMESHADTTTAEWWLGVISFLEASILPLPPSAFMLGMVALGKERRWVYLATLTTVTSVLGGLFGYIVGSVLFDTLGQWIIDRYSLVEEMARLGELFSDNAFLAIFVGAFTPIPYKAFTIASGFFSINVLIFTVASVLGRGLRFFVVGYVAKVFGEHVAGSILKYFAILTLVAVAILIIIGFVQVV